MSAKRDELVNTYLIALTQSLPQLVWMSRDFGEWVWASPRWTEHTGQDVEQSQGHKWLMAIYPDDRDAFLKAWQDAERSGVLDIEHRLLAVDPSKDVRWFYTHATPLPTIPGQPREWIGSCTDIHDKEASSSRVETQENSSHHRVDEVLTLVRLMVRKSLSPGMSAEDYMVHLDSRLEAIARVQIMLRHGYGRADIAEIVSDALLAYASHEGDHIEIDGPSLLLESFAAELFGLAVHELVMNVVEHGALSGTNGHIKVAWRLEDGLLHFEWKQAKALQLSSQPLRKGFGTELIEKTLKLRLGAMTKLSFEPQGVHCVIILPVEGNVTSGNEGPPG